MEPAVLVDDGRQLREVLSEGRLESSLVEHLENALEIRNFLAYDYFREHAKQFLSFDGRNKMLTELENLRAELEAVDNELEPITRSLLESKGTSEALVQAELERLLREHGDRG